jgi:adenylosuccinate lyase
MNQDQRSTITALNPLDGRYKDKTEALSPFLSEYALIKYRVEIEIKYLLALSKNKIIRELTQKEQELLTSIYADFSVEDAIKVKAIEEETRHDVKAIEKYLRNKFNESSLKDIAEMIHFGLTSEDVNNIIYRLMLKDALEKVVLPKLSELNNELKTRAKKYKTIVILGRTHGQAAIPTTFGKEMAVFYARLARELTSLEKPELTGKLNGAIGNFNSFYFADPEVDWIKFSTSFIYSLGLLPNLITTQINPFEDVIALLQTLQRANGILLDFNQDMWRYISDGWLKLAVKEKEVGSSTMPQKVNPIDFENSEGNLILANGLMQAMIDKLYISRLQRDLTNSTIIRNLGTVLGYSLLAYKSALTGLARTDVNVDKINEDLNHDWSILSEGLQTFLRKEGFTEAYDYVKKNVRGKQMDKKAWEDLIRSLPLDEKQKEKLLKLTPTNYIGVAEKLVDEI